MTCTTFLSRTRAARCSKSKETPGKRERSECENWRETNVNQEVHGQHAFSAVTEGDSRGRLRPGSPRQRHRIESRGMDDCRGGKASRPDRAQVYRRLMPQHRLPA